MEWLVSGFRTKLTAAIVGFAIFLSSRSSSFGSEGNTIVSCIMTRHSSHRIAFRLLDMPIPLFRDRWQTLALILALGACRGALRARKAFSALGSEASVQRLWRRGTRLLAGWGFGRNGSQRQVRTTVVCYGYVATSQGPCTLLGFLWWCVVLGDQIWESLQCGRFPDVGRTVYGALCVYSRGGSSFRSEKFLLVYSAASAMASALLACSFSQKPQSGSPFIRFPFWRKRCPGCPNSWRRRGTVSFTVSGHVFTQSLGELADGTCLWFGEGHVRW